MFGNSLLIFCPTIKKLQLCNVTIDILRKNYFQNDYAGAIEFLSVDGLDHRTLPRKLSSGFDFSPLRHLKLYLFRPDACNFLRTILDKCNQSLETLNCTLDSNHNCMSAYLLSYVEITSAPLLLLNLAFCDNLLWSP
ncbi:hypothetical protein BDQ12DRAFT_63955 [Crucibulum laeve]|uniref:Uncharacterized protein n=1 Tax=Crucibulum laeve TaxID=68775 RepID=A0A5C3LFY7_9AGAR|nr:hypothetical protein BDQ12DRAFT_63955 [Crucibulum laeve]